ncbi:hypothetical protein QUF75_16885 [Desulfococcaceae bacterium HSG7]|nr:hypothetical protein [Desulfococcaceae bacterium HSG7]
MFRKTSPQLSFFEVDRYFRDALPGDDRSFIYKKEISPLMDEEKFRHLYVRDKGRPDESIRTMLSLLIFMGIEKYTWRGTEFQFSRRIDRMLATNTPQARRISIIRPFSDFTDYCREMIHVWIFLRSLPMHLSSHAGLL